MEDLKKYKCPDSTLAGRDEQIRIAVGMNNDDIIAEVSEAIDIAAPGGGYILASDHSLHDGIPVENIKIMFETGRKYGEKYCHP